jgi:hypothetical protein
MVSLRMLLFMINDVSARAIHYMVHTGILVDGRTCQALFEAR